MQRGCGIVVEIAHGQKARIITGQEEGSESDQPANCFYFLMYSGSPEKLRLYRTSFHIFSD